MECESGNCVRSVQEPSSTIGVKPLKKMRALPTRMFRPFVITGLAAINMFGQVPGPEPSCSGVVLRLQYLKRPPTFHIGETIRARLSLSASGRLGFTALPDTRRGFFHEILTWEPERNAIDPSSLGHRIRVGSASGSGWSEDRNREIDINEWAQFERPGHYVLRAALKHIVLKSTTEKTGGPWLNCELKSNVEPLEILPPDAQWEAAELARADRLLESDPPSFAGASALRYLNTPEAAVALARWYLRLAVEPVISELAQGIFESRYAGIVQRELEKSLRSGIPFKENAMGTLALLEVERQFRNRPCPPDPTAAQAWSREYWGLFESVKSKYMAEAARPSR
jgi:hypothetical protein